MLEHRQFIGLVLDQYGAVGCNLHFDSGTALVRDVLSKNGEILPSFKKYELSILRVTPIANANSANLVDMSDKSQFTMTLTAPISGKYEFKPAKQGGGIIYLNTERRGQQDFFDLAQWGSFQFLHEFDHNERYIEEGTPLLRVIHKTHSERFKKEIEHKRSVRKAEDRLAALKREEAEFKKQRQRVVEQERKKILAESKTQKAKSKALLENAKRASENANKEAESLIRAAEQEAKNTLNEANVAKSSALELLAKSKTEAQKEIEIAKREGGKIRREAKAKGVALTKDMVAKVKSEVKKNKEDIESQRKIASKTVKKQQADANATKRTANAKAKEILTNAQRDAEQLKSEAEAQLSQITDRANELGLKAVIQRLYDLMGGGAKADLIDRPQLRMLAFRLNQLVADSQGVPPPETASLLNTQNKYDELDAMYEALAEKVNSINAREKWPDDVKERAIEALMSSAEVKTGSLTDEDLTYE